MKWWKFSSLTTWFVKEDNVHHFMSAGATEKSLQWYIVSCEQWWHDEIKLLPYLRQVVAPTGCSTVLDHGCDNRDRVHRQVGVPVWDTAMHTMWSVSYRGWGAPASNSPHFVFTLQPVLIQQKSMLLHNYVVLSPGHSQLFNVSWEKWEGLVHDGM